MLNGYVFVNKAALLVGKVMMHKSWIHAQFSDVSLDLIALALALLYLIRLL